MNHNKDGCVDFNILIPTKNLEVPFAAAVIENISRFIKPKQIHIITHKSQNLSSIKLDEAKLQNIFLFDEEKIIEGLNIRIIQAYLKNANANPSRAGWYFQQFLKMGYAILSSKDSSTFAHALINGGGGGQIADIKITPYYLIWDFDCIVLNELQLFVCDDKDIKPCFEKASEYHKPYFDTLEKLQIPTKDNEILTRLANHSFIAENMMIESALMRELINRIEKVHNARF